MRQHGARIPLSEGHMGSMWAHDARMHWPEDHVAFMHLHGARIDFQTLLG